MITRFNRENQTTNKNHREQLGEVIAFYRNARGHDVRFVARVVGCSIALVEQFEAGKAVPTSDQWGKLKRAVNGGLREFGDVWRAAAEEQLAEHEALQARRRAEERQNVEQNKTNGTPRHAPHAPAIGTNLGSKLASVQPPIPHKPFSALADVRLPAPIAPPPEPEPVQTPVVERKTRKPIPPGAMTSEAIERRRQYVRDLIGRRPGIRGSGPDSVNSELLATFGVTMDHNTIERLRAEVEGSRGAPQLEVGSAQRDTKPANVPEAAPPIVAVAPPHSSGDVNEADLAAAVDLILASVPGLQTFTIAVDDDGHATVDYQIRKVVITTAGGSLKVQRRG